MARIAEPLRYTEDDLKSLKGWASSRSLGPRGKERVKIILMSIEGRTNASIAAELRITGNTVGQWRRRFNEGGIESLLDRPRPGRASQPAHGQVLKSVLELLETRPPKGLAAWDGKAVAEALGLSDDKVWRVLRAEGVFLQRRRGFRVSADSGLAAKAVELEGLYLSPPEMALAICVDETPSPRPLEPSDGQVLSSSGEMAKALDSAGRRLGGLSLAAALEAAAAQIGSKSPESAKSGEPRKRLGLLEFLAQLAAGRPPGQEIHVILASDRHQGRRGRWLAAHPGVAFHLAPTPESWLSMVEIWLGLMAGKALKEAKPRGPDDLTRAICGFILAYEDDAEPFAWRRRGATGARLEKAAAQPGD
jgi:transposase